MNTQYLEREGGKIAYDVTGNGPLVICVPSMGDVRDEYRFLIPQLVAAGFKVATMDLRGHGQSSVEWPDYSDAALGQDVIALARHLDAGPAAVIGESMGGAAAVYAAAEAPERVTTLVLVDPFVRDTGSGGILPRLYALLFADPWGPAVWSWYYNSLYPTHKPADFATYRTALVAMLRQPGRMRALRKMIMVRKSASDARLGRVAAPTLIVMGSKDPDFKDPAAEANLVCERIRGSAVRMIEGAGHYPHAEMPEVTGPIVTQFLQSVHRGERNGG